MLKDKMYYSISEVSEEFGVAPSALRYWEKYFPVLKPEKNKRNVRLYRKQDVETIRKIVYLTREKGLSLDGVKKELSRQRIQGGEEEVLQTLLDTRDFLLELKKQLN